MAQTHEQRIIWADHVQKLNRKDGKVRALLAVLAMFAQNCLLTFIVFYTVYTGHMHTHTHSHTRTHACTHTHAHTHAYTCTRTHTCTHIHTHSHNEIKGVPEVLVVTGTSFMVLDPKSLALKYRVELADLQQISLSSYADNIFVMHINPVSPRNDM